MVTTSVLVALRGPDESVYRLADCYKCTARFTFFSNCNKPTNYTRISLPFDLKLCIISGVRASAEPLEQEKRHPAFRPLDGTTERDQWERERYSVRKQVREEELRGPVVRVAAEEAKNALALALAASPAGTLEVPDISQAHRAIYTRLEHVWVDACNGEYIVTQAKLAVLKLMCHVCGVDAALKASKQKLTNKVNSDDAIEHMRKLGVVRTSEPDECEMPRRSVELATPPAPSPAPPPAPSPAPENPPARRP
jgi:hypothetical protein